MWLAGIWSSEIHLTTSAGYIAKMLRKAGVRRRYVNEMRINKSEIGERGRGYISEIASCWYWRPRGCGIEIMSNTVKLDNMSMTPLLTAPSSSSSPHVTLIWGVWAWIEERLAMNVKIVVESVNVAECDDWNGKLRPFFSYPLNQKMAPNHMKNKAQHS